MIEWGELLLLEATHLGNDVTLFGRLGLSTRIIRLGLRINNGVEKAPSPARCKGILELCVVCAYSSKLEFAFAVSGAVFVIIGAQRFKVHVFSNFVLL